MFRSLTQKCSQDFHTEKTAMIGDKCMDIPVKKSVNMPNDSSLEELLNPGTLTIRGSICPRMATPECLKICSSRFDCEATKGIFLHFLLQDPKITVRVATDYFQVPVIMMSEGDHK